MKYPISHPPAKPQSHTTLLWSTPGSQQKQTRQGEVLLPRNKLALLKSSFLPVEICVYLSEKLDQAQTQRLPAIGPTFGGYGKVNGRPVPAARTPIMDVSRPIIDKLIDLGINDPQQLPIQLVALRYHWLSHAGHAPLRHVLTEADEAAQRARLLLKHDPITASDIDWETGLPHRKALTTSAFLNPAAIVLAEAKLWKSMFSEQQRSCAEINNLSVFLAEIPAKEVFGKDFRSYIAGWALKDSGHTQHIENIKFPDDTVISGKYRRDENFAYWRPYILYPCRPEHRAR